MSVSSSSSRTRPTVELPDAGDERLALGQGEHDLRRGAVRVAQHAHRQAVGVEHRVALLLPAVARDRLAEVAGAVEQADADDRHAEVGGALQVVAGEDAEAARVLRQRGRDAELGREVGDRARARRRRATGTSAARSGSGAGRRAARSPGRRRPRRPRAPRAGPRATSPSRPIGSLPRASQTSGAMSRNSSSVGWCHDHRRLPASSSSAARGSGSTVRTVKRRMAFTRTTLGGADYAGVTRGVGVGVRRRDGRGRAPRPRAPCGGCRRCRR